MILEYFKLAEQPFGVTPNPRYLYLSPTHREALASVYYGVTSGRGFTALIAPPGMGKTTLLFDFLSKTGNVAKTVFLFQAQPTPRDLLRNLLEDLGIEPQSEDIGHMQRLLNECLIREFNEGKQLIVVIDEAQNLDEGVLEVVRMLSNFETPRQKLLHLILSGQPALAEKLASPRLVQLRQRISTVAHLKRFDTDETNLYINHRLRVAGYQGKTSLFTKQALEMIALHSGGIPRNINTLCFNALSLACALRSPTINSDVMEEVIRDLDLSSLYQPQFEPVTLQSLDLPRNSPRSKDPGLFGARWMKATLALCLLLVFLGILSRTNWRSLHLPASFSFRKFLPSSSLRPSSAPSVSTAENSSAATPGAAVVDSAFHPEDTTTAPEVALVPAPSTNKDSAAKTYFVTVQRRQTIFDLCKDNFGRYDAAALARIRELNPNLGNVRRLKIGQKIRMPANGKVSAPVRDIDAAGSEVSGAQAETP
jgi:type II secretory pathway predicted ATPase ExeA